MNDREKRVDQALKYVATELSWDAADFDTICTLADAYREMRLERNEAREDADYWYTQYHGLSADMKTLKQELDLCRDENSNHVADVERSKSEVERLRDALINIVELQNNDQDADIAHTALAASSQNALKNKGESTERDKEEI